MDRFPVVNDFLSKNRFFLWRPPTQSSLVREGDVFRSLRDVDCEAVMSLGSYVWVSSQLLTEPAESGSPLRRPRDTESLYRRLGALSSLIF